MRTSMLLLALLSTGGLGASGMPHQAPAAAIDVQQLGPQVGARVPDFTLRDQQGAARTLSASMGRKGAVLVFFRSADW